MNSNPRIKRISGSTLDFLRCGVGQYEEREPSMPERIEPGRALQAANQTLCCKDAGKRKNPWNQNKCREEVSTRNH
jgi:hypothetical protein